jgi:hypothetical protein
LQLAGVDFAGERGDHAAVFKLVESATRCGKNHYWSAGVAESEQFHLAAEPVGETFVIFAIHWMRAPDQVRGDWRTADFLLL